MRFLLILLLILIPMAAEAASAQESYLAARDAHIAKFKAIDDAKKIDDDTNKQHDLAMDELGRLLRAIIGPVAIEGFPADGKANLDTLFTGDQGFGVLDGLLYSSPDDKTNIIVTTEGLLDHWLKEHKDWWGPKLASVPQEIIAALKSDELYAQALRTDAAIVKFAELPVAKLPKAKFAFGLLVARTQSEDPLAPDELVVTVVQAGRVFVASTPMSTKAAPIAACRKILETAKRRAVKAQEAYIASGPKDDKLSNLRERLEQEGNKAFHRCFAGRAKSQAFYAAAISQAKALVDRLPLR